MLPGKTQIRYCIVMPQIFHHHSRYSNFFNIILGDYIVGGSSPEKKNILTEGNIKNYAYLVLKQPMHINL